VKLLWEMLSLFEDEGDTSGGELKHGKTKRARGDDYKAIELPINSLIIFLFLHLHPESLNVKTYTPASVRLSTESVPWGLDETGPGQLSPRSPTPYNSRHSFPSSPGSSHQSPRGPNYYSGGCNSPVSPRMSRSLRLQNRSADEAQRLIFFKKQLVNILWLISGKGNHSDEVLSRFMTRTELSSLNFIIYGGKSLEEIHNAGMSDLVPMLSNSKRSKDLQRGRGKRGKNYSKSQMTKDTVGTALDINNWMHTVLVPNDVFYPLTSIPGPLISVNLDGRAEDDGDMSPTRPSKKVIGTTNEPTRLPEPIVPATPIVVNYAHKTTVQYVGWAAASPERNFFVNNCYESTVYLLSPSKQATIFGCVDCTIVLGACSGMVRLDECSRVNIIVACRRLCVVNCCESTIYLYSPSRPVFTGDNRSCIMAPYNTTYHNLLGHLTSCSLLNPNTGTPPRNLWSLPIDLSCVVSATTAAVLTPRAAARAGADEAHPHALGGGSGSVTIIPPESFRGFTIPQSEGDSALQGGPTIKQNPFPLPTEYVAALKDRETQVHQLQQLIHNADLNPQEMREVEEALRMQFADWLVSSGHLREVVDLVQIEKSRGENVSPRSQFNDASKI